MQRGASASGSRNDLIVEGARREATEPARLESESKVMKKRNTLEQAANTRNLSSQELDATAGGFSDWDTCDWAGRLGGSAGGAAGAYFGGALGGAVGTAAGDAGASYLCESIGDNNYWGGGAYTNGNPHQDYSDWQ